MRPFALRSTLSASLILLLAACQPQESAPIAGSSAPAHPAKPAPVVPTADGHYSADITAEDFAARLKKVSSDEFEGRKPGTQGERTTTAWIKDQFAQIGLKPGNRGDWGQTVPMVETTLLDPDQVSATIKAGGGTETFAYRKDMIVGSLTASPAADIKESDIVFAGYGVDAPEYQWNDYAGLDVKGKTVIVLINDPGWGNHDDTLFKGRALTYYGRWTYKYEEAARKGAVACLIVHETPGAGYPWDVVVNSWSGPQDSLPPSEDPAPRLSAAGWLTTEAAQRLFAKAGRNFDELKKSADLRGFKSTEVGATLSLGFKSRIEHSSSENVLGLLPGSTRPEEVIVYSAHWDHFGRDPNLKGDPIYHGAIDNGTGIAGLLEIAEAFAHQNPPPQRSILFLADTLEEAGLLGSRYYVTHPVFPLDKTVADINMDALPIMGPAKDIAVISWGQSQLDDYIQQAATTEGRTIVPDDAPEKGFFFRSDQLNFARLGVPVLYARSGLNLVDGGEEAGRKAYADYTANHYHKPSDVYDPNWDFRGVIDDLKAFHAVGRKLADETRFPDWKAGADFHRTQPVASK
ncbi:M28 family metallopeptidase [Dokdonella soli]|uniref:M28 family metallopeptidase n=1 Tax=Dokdonella soli TaxID=529810 RepID=A0ABN1IEB8_9GAMM